MKKIIQILLILILLLIFAGLIIFIFNPADTRNKIIGSFLNYYLEKNLPAYEAKKENAESSTSTSTDKNPLLNNEQEKTLESYGVDVEKLPSEVSPEMEECLVGKIGLERAKEIAGGSSPTAMEIFKGKECLGE